MAEGAATGAAGEEVQAGRQVGERGGALWKALYTAIVERRMTPTAWAVGDDFFIDQRNGGLSIDVSALMKHRGSFLYGYPCKP
jgi:hypothetical protein